MEYTPRLSVVLTMDQYKKMRKLIPWGLRGYLFSELVDQVVGMVEIYGENVIAQIISGEISLQKGEIKDDKYKRAKKEYNRNDNGGVEGTISTSPAGKKNSAKGQAKYQKDGFSLKTINQSKVS